MDGQLIKTWEVHCRCCQSASLGLRGEKNDAAEELRRYGWGTRMGYWVCSSCLPGVPRGTMPLTPDQRFDAAQRAEIEEAAHRGDLETT